MLAFPFSGARLSRRPAEDGLRQDFLTMAMPCTFPQVGQTLSWWVNLAVSLTTLPVTSPLG